MATYQISSGFGPAECELAVARFAAFAQVKYPVWLESSTPGVLCAHGCPCSILPICLSDFSSSGGKKPLWASTMLFAMDSPSP